MLKKGPCRWDSLVLLEAIKAYVEVGFEISPLAWIVVLRRQCQTLRKQEGWATLILACKPEVLSKQDCVDMCGLWLLTDTNSALQEKAFLKKQQRQLRSSQKPLHSRGL